jgi:hypothetical protein
MFVKLLKTLVDLEGVEPSTSSMPFIGATFDGEILIATE